MGRGYRYARRRNLVATPESSDILAVAINSSDMDEEPSDVSGLSVPGPRFNHSLLLWSQHMHVNITKLEFK
jgi:hypothetical protein